MKAVILHPTIGYNLRSVLTFWLVDSDFMDKRQLPFSPPIPSKPTADTFQLAFAVPEEWGVRASFLLVSASIPWRP